MARLRRLTVPLPSMATLSYIHAFDGRNRARALHDANAARRRPPPTRRANQPRRPPEQIAPALGVLLTRAASLRATEPLTQGALLERIFSDGFHIANAHAVDAAPDTAETAPPPPPFPAHRRNCSLCAGRHLDTDCELIHGPLPSNRRSCATCSGRHWDDYCRSFGSSIYPRPPPSPTSTTALLLHHPPSLTHPPHLDQLARRNASCLHIAQHSNHRRHPRATRASPGLRRRSPLLSRRQCLARWRLRGPQRRSSAHRPPPQSSRRRGATPRRARGRHRQTPSDGAGTPPSQRPPTSPQQLHRSTS